ncbi:dihydroneopterin aldolase [Cognatishimia sp. F0-27]|uniref:dihydroneopterin aldolase n=1 Tax=Cognatishimia sp. F0-27 TaxID=2816855 RepID=UPI001D0C06E7|nr:dihydroneopterin aldolase [Cognatishimia sp. F0-27]
MDGQSHIELSGLKLTTDIGTYGPGDVVPEAHILDLRLKIDPRLVLIDTDDMDRVFDYDPLIAEIDRLARDGHYETQERLMTRIVHACAAFPQIMAIEVKLSKTPVVGKTGQLGVHLALDERVIMQIRET